MSFAEQERVLFDLIFDHPLREQFCHTGLNALDSYDLTIDEKNDFATIRPEALILDAHMRINLILSRFCRDLPLSFAIVSSLEKGNALLQTLVDTQTMTSSSQERVVLFASRLQAGLTPDMFSFPEEHYLAISVLNTELEMAKTAQQLRAVMLEGKKPKEESPIPEGCLDKPAKLADYVSATVIPQPYPQLKSLLCPCSVDELWNHLNKTPLSKKQRNIALQQQNPRLLIVRAHPHRFSQCVPEVKHHTVEVSEGFATLLHHLDGSNSINEVLQQFQQAGAPEQMIQSIRNGFLQLWELKMLVLI